MQPAVFFVFKIEEREAKAKRENGGKGTGDRKTVGADPRVCPMPACLSDEKGHRFPQIGADGFVAGRAFYPPVRHRYAVAGSPVVCTGPHISLRCFVS